MSQRRRNDGASSWYDKTVNTEYQEEVMPISKGKLEKKDVDFLPSFDSSPPSSPPPFACLLLTSFLPSFLPSSSSSSLPPFFTPSPYLPPSSSIGISRGVGGLGKNLFRGGGMDSFTSWSTDGDFQLQSTRFKNNVALLLVATGVTSPSDVSKYVSLAFWHCFSYSAVLFFQ